MGLCSIVDHQELCSWTPSESSILASRICLLAWNAAPPALQVWRPCRACPMQYSHNAMQQAPEIQLLMLTLSGNLTPDQVVKIWVECLVGLGIWKGANLIGVQNV